jgi:hypothetical protein
MKQIYTYNKILTETNQPSLYLYKFPIQIGSKKMYKITIKGDVLDIDSEFKQEIRENSWKSTDLYRLVSLEDQDITVFYK